MAGQSVELANERVELAEAEPKRLKKVLCAAD